MGAGRAMESWGHHGRFSYQGNLGSGLKIILGVDRSFVVSPGVLSSLLAHFAGRVVPIGASRNPARDSLGAWLRSRVDAPLAAAYVGPILVKEGVAERDGKDALRFFDG